MICSGRLLFYFSVCDCVMPPCQELLSIRISGFRNMPGHPLFQLFLVKPRNGFPSLAINR